MEKIRIGIVGFGNLGRACRQLIEERTDDFELAAVFGKHAGENTLCIDDLEKYKGKIDVCLVCVGSKQDAPVIVPQIAANFNTVDSFDTHSKIKEYMNSIKPAGVSIVAAGWDPGLMSVIRIYFSGILTKGVTQSFWGPGVSMGHSNALKQISGVTEAIQFTVPNIKQNKHNRVCYVVASTKNHTKIRHTILNMPDYFAGQNVKVHFVSQTAFDKKFKNRSEHKGTVIAADGDSRASFSLAMKNNAHFTAGVMLAYAIANYNLQKESKTGVFTAADIAPKYLFRRSIFDLL